MMYLAIWRGDVHHMWVHRKQCTVSYHLSPLGGSCWLLFEEIRPTSPFS
jgi:hypothetical protein